MIRRNAPRRILSISMFHEPLHPKFFGMGRNAPRRILSISIALSISPPVLALYKVVMRRGAFCLFQSQAANLFPMLSLSRNAPRRILSISIPTMDT